MSRADAIADFLRAAGCGSATRTPLAGDASARTYVRLRSGEARAILMDMPPESGLDARPFLAVTDWLHGLGFSAPQVLAADPGRGLVLLEDLGDALFARICATDRRREAALYGAAIDLVADLQRHPPPRDTADYAPPPYDRALLLREVRLVPEWYLPAATGLPTSADLAAEYEGLIAPLLDPVLAAAPVPVLRDFHAENLLWLPERAGHARIGLLDYQDLLVGHPAYDVVSLIEDARRDTGPQLRAAMMARYIARSGADPQAFGLAAHVLAAQRNLKILGLFVRLWRRDGKPGYLRHLTRVRDHLERDLAHPALAGLRGWVTRHLPPPDAVMHAQTAAARA